MATTKTASPKSRLVSAPEIAPVLATALSAQSEYQRTITELWPTLNPQVETSPLRALIKTEKDIAVIRKASARLAELESPSAKLATDRVAALARQALNKFREPLKTLLETAVAVCDRLITEAKAAEVEFFKSWSVAGTETAVSGSVRTLKSQVVALQKTLVDESPRPAMIAIMPRPGSHSDIVAFFK